MCKYNSLKVNNVIKIWVFLVNYNRVLNVLYYQQKIYCTCIYFALYGAYSVLSSNYFPNSECHSWGKEKLMYNITASLLLGLGNIWVCLLCQCFWQLCYWHVVYGHPNAMWLSINTPKYLIWSLRSIYRIFMSNRFLGDVTTI